MNSSCVLPLLVVFALCESVPKARQAPASISNVGKFRRDVDGRLELPRQVGAGASLKRNRSFGNLLRTSDLKIDPLGYGNTMEKPLSVPSSPEQSQAFGKFVNDCLKKREWRSPSDRSSLVSKHLASLKVNPTYNDALKDRFKFVNADFNKRFEDIARFSEPSKNYSDGPFQRPESLKVNSQIKDLISQSLFAKPISSDSSKTFKSDLSSNIGINDGLNNEPSNSISLKLLLNKNISDILSLSKPVIPTKITSLTIMGNKNGDVKPFQLLTQGDKLADKIDQTQTDTIAKKSDEKILEKQNDVDITDLLKNKIADPNPATEEGAIKSARRLFDVIQSQSPLDLLNIPLLMDSFKRGSSGISTKISNAKLGSGHLEPAVIQPLGIDLSAFTTQKSAIPEDHVTNKNEKFVVSPQNTNMFETTVSKPLSLLLPRNHSYNYLPWRPLSSILTPNIPNIPLILIPLNKIRLESVMTSPEKDSSDFHCNITDINKSFVPLAEEMRKVFNYQDMFSKHFNDFNLKDLIDFGSMIQKSEQKTGESLNLLSIPSLKKPNEMEFQKRVEDFLKQSRLNTSDFQRKLDVTEKSEPPPDEDALKTSELARMLNSSHLTQDSKKIKFHDRVSILPLLKVTANMALSKYSIPRVDKKLLDDMTGSKGNVSSNQPPMAHINIENSSINTMREGSYFTEMNYAISTEANVDKRLNELNGPALENTSASIGLTELPCISLVGAEKRNESEPLLPAADSLSSVMKSVANNFILQTIKEFEQTLKLDPKRLGHENLEQTNTSYEANQSNSQTLGSDRAYPEDNGFSTVGSLDTVQTVTIPANESFNSGNDTFSDDNSQTVIDSKNDDLNPNSSDDLSHKQLSKEEETSMSSLDVLSAEAALTLTTENVNPEYNSTEIFPQDAGNSIGNINLERSLQLGKQVKASYAQIQELLSAALNDDTKDNSKCTRNLNLQKNANSVNISSPLKISDVRINQPVLSVGNSQHTRPVVMVSKQKNRLQHCNSESPIFGNASYYMSNKTRQHLELGQRKDVRSEIFQIPAVLIEILNRMESTIQNPGGTGCKMVFVSGGKNESEQNFQPTEVTDTHFERISQSIDSNDDSDIPVKGSLTPITVTTECPAYTRADNIYQVVTLKNDQEKGAEERIIFHSPTPRAGDCCDLLHNYVAEKIEPTSTGKFVQKPFSTSHNNRPIILVAIDPLRAWEGQSTSDQRSMGYMPLGIIIKSTSVFGRPELNETAVRGGTSLIGEVGQSCAEFKCTTACPVEPGKCKEVTIFPIYPMYPVYPLKPIIATNNTTTLLTARTK